MNNEKELKEWYESRTSQDVSVSNDTIAFSAETEKKEVKIADVLNNMSGAMVSMEIAEQLMHGLRSLSRTSTYLVKKLNVKEANESEEQRKSVITNWTRDYLHNVKRIIDLKEQLDQTFNLIKEEK